MYGDIFKVIRKKKGFTQKEIYAGIVSKTFYSDFEDGKYSIEVSKFECLLENLGISYEEFSYHRELYQPNEIKQLETKIDKLYNQGKFEELYHIYETNYTDEHKEIRYLAVNAYLLVLITNTNFYKFSREPLREIIADLKNAKMWTLREIKRAKLVLLSLSEKNQEDANQIFLRIQKELKKYQEFDLK